MHFLILLTLLFSTPVLADCIHETTLNGHEVKQLLQKKHVKIHVKIGDRYIETNKLELSQNRSYVVQIQHPTVVTEELLEYYSVNHMARYLNHMTPTLINAGYQLQVVGSSIEGRKLYGIWPNQIDPSKKTVVMFGRQHGDESTANWIIEGFLNSVFQSTGQEWLEEFQLVIYPMVNPDGAAAKTRYNANSYDINREWASSSSEEKDEARIIHDHLRSLSLNKKNIVTSLDMHGSYWLMKPADFIYHVRPDFIDQNFYNRQLSFIEDLATRDPWNGNSVHSNGHPRMARIVFSQVGINALTHETPRDIPVSSSRTIANLKSQGVAIYETIAAQYGD